jgi:hypothetical protein
MSEHDYFSADYAAARGTFLEACQAAGLQPDSHRLATAAGPDGTELYTDVVWVGPADASGVLVICSGTHGVEGFYGSGCQVGWFAEGRHRRLPDDVAVLLVHAINPYGFAWLRRVTEDNVDLNRNFIDHARPPANPGYGEFHRWLLPEAWTEATPADIQSRIAAFVASSSHRAFRQAVVGGQYSHPDGLFYGGERPCWSNRLIGRIAEQYLQRAARVAVVDLHTGLGPYGYAEIICRHPVDSAALARARTWYGDAVTSAQAGESESPPIDGNLRMAFVNLCPRAEVTAVAIEVGTLPSPQVLMALCADNWLHLRGERDSDLGRRIKRDIRDAFFPDVAAWTEPAYRRSMEILGQAVRELGRGT